MSKALASSCECICSYLATREMVPVQICSRQAAKSKKQCTSKKDYTD